MTKDLYLFCDGGSRGNPGSAALAVVVKDSQGRVITRLGKSVGLATNNQAEYQAAIAGLKWLSCHLKGKGRTIKKAFFYLDSQLVVNQLNGFYRIKDPVLRSYLLTIRLLEREIESIIIYQQIPREKNKEADNLVNQVLDKTTS